ncbi:hypothetical protein LVB77_19835 [Lysobacter sp. 5GHs7-4]|uniref:hypothetical protein n=1 Tax=Lysobacter sp. 5GHs7-4 TaxID=2904253 RepID=UPI001E31B746|nr:hypothetical protein [Lysobacter sp. 5GHs7-4]UHQ22870.1 hypothetical protein LVB77_19835 [Lysobacter sp. 5GHs7-4]
MFKRFLDIFRDDPPPNPPPAQQPAPQAPQQAQPHHAAVPPVPPPAAADAAVPLDPANPRFALDDAGQQKLMKLNQNDRQDLVAAFKQPEDYINVRGMTLQHLMDLPDQERSGLLRASKQFGALEPAERTGVLQALDDPRSFISLAEMDVGKIAGLSRQHRDMLLRQNQDFSAATQGHWTAGPRTDEQAQALGNQFFTRNMLHLYGTVGFSNQVPLNETARYQHAFVNAMKQGFVAPNLPPGVPEGFDLSTFKTLPSQQVEAIRDTLRNCPAKQIVMTAQTVGTNLGSELTMVGMGGDIKEQRKAQAPGHGPSM